jgi:hypothetical protein
MNKVNPLHIGALLLTVLIFLFFKLGTLKEQLDESKLTYKESKQIANKLSALEEIYGDQRKINTSIQRVLRQPSLKTVKIVVLPSKESMKISAKAINANELNSLMGKVFNGNYNVSRLEIIKTDANKASLEMEIKW